jgi:hypothetical protein
MLTTLEANFVQEYKQVGSPTKALRNAGSKAKESSLPVLAYRLMRKPEIKKIIDDYTVNLVNEVAKPVLSSVNPMITNVNPIKVINIPTREQYAETAWKRSSDESKLKDDLKHKYYETTGKVLKYIGNDAGDTQQGNTFNVMCAELRISLNAEGRPILEEIGAVHPSLPPSNTPSVPIDNIPNNNMTNNQIDLTHENKSSDPATE